jgi:hypothetical protein
MKPQLLYKNQGYDNVGRVEAREQFQMSVRVRSWQNNSRNRETNAISKRAYENSSGTICRGLLIAHVTEYTNVNNYTDTWFLSSPVIRQPGLLQLKTNYVGNWIIKRDVELWYRSQFSI